MKNGKKGIEEQKSQCTLYNCTVKNRNPNLPPTESNQSAGPVRFLIFCSISIFLLASLVAGRRHQCNAGAVQQEMYSTISLHWNIKSAPASPGRSRVGPAFYVFSFLATPIPWAPQHFITQLFCLMSSSKFLSHTLLAEPRQFTMLQL